MQFPTQPGAVSKGSFWAGCILSALPVLLFAFTGVFSLLKPAVSVQGFVHYGYPEGALLRMSESIAAAYLTHNERSEPRWEALE